MSWSTVLLIGDSITQRSLSVEGRWGALLADRFQRMADIICRGFSGYNSRWVKVLLPKILDDINANAISCVTIFLGANDCSLPASEQYVPIDEFKQNLETMVGILESRGVNRQKIIFITPTIYFHSNFEAACIAKKHPKPLRSEDQQQIYANAMIELGKKISVSVVDAYSTFAADGRGENLLADGLHFSSAGADLLYSALVKDVEARVLAFRGETTETMNFANWRDIDPNNLEGSILGQTGK